MQGFTLTAQDTLVLKEIPVYSGRMKPYVSYQRTDNIDSAYLASVKGGTLSQVLTDRSSVYLKEYGNGMLSTPSFRGTSAMHTALMWNGIPMLNPSLGQTDLNTVPVMAGDRITVFHGQGSPVFGSGAIGGTITLQSSALPLKGYRAEVASEVGSFGYHAFRASAAGAYKKWSIQAGFYFADCANNFSYFDPYTQKEKQQQAANWYRRGITAQLQYRFNKNLSVTLRSWYHSSDRNLQPPMGVSPSNENQVDNDIRTAGELNWKNKLGAMQMRMAWFKEDIVYQSNSVYSRSLVNTLQVHAEQELLSGKKYHVMVGGNLQYFTADNTGYGMNIKTQYRGAFFALLRYQPLRYLKLMVNLRQQWVEGYAIPFIPGGGAELTIFKNEHQRLFVKASASLSYRVPTLNERFWTPGGNPDLLPEKGYATEGGIGYSYCSRKVTLETELTTYYTRIKDWVQWLPLPPSAIYTPVNIAQVQTQGLEWGANAAWKVYRWKLSAGVRYAYTSSVTKDTQDPHDASLNKQLIYVPYQRTVSWLQADWRGVSFQFNHQFTGYRYTTSDNTAFLPSYSTINLRLAYQYQWAGYKAELFFKVNNLTNVSYQTVQNRAMPGVFYQTGLTISFYHLH